MNEPPNRAIGWYRFMLWVMPTCVAITTVIGATWLRSAAHMSQEVLMGIWFAVNIASTLALGTFEARVHRSQKGSSKKANMDRVGWFFAAQILLIPVLSCAIWFAACLVSAM